MADEIEQAPGEIPHTVGYDYIKSNLFRVIAINGAYGGISPRGQMCLSLWNERKPIPQHVVHTLNVSDEGVTLGDEIKEERVSRDSFIREVEVCAMMDIDSARTVAKWMLQAIADFESRFTDGAPTH